MPMAREPNWSSGTGAFSYEIIVKRISDPNQSVVLNQKGITGTTPTTPTVFTSGTYPLVDSWTGC